VGTIHAVFQSGLNGGYGTAHRITVKTLFQWLGAAQKQLANVKSMQAEAENKRNEIDISIKYDTPEIEFLSWATVNKIYFNFYL